MSSLEREPEPAVRKTQLLEIISNYLRRLNSVLTDEEMIELQKLVDVFQKAQPATAREFAHLYQPIKEILTPALAKLRQTKLHALYERTRQAIGNNGLADNLRLHLPGTHLTELPLTPLPSSNGNGPINDVPAEVESKGIRIDTTPLRDIPRSPFEHIDFVDLVITGNGQGSEIHAFATEITPHAQPEPKRQKPLLPSLLAKFSTRPDTRKGEPRLHAQPLSLDQIGFLLGNLATPENQSQTFPANLVPNPT